MAMKSLNLRQAIIQRVENKTDAELIEVIEDSIGSDERSLPGLGVLFEIIWRHIGQEQREQLVTALQTNMKSGQA